MRVLWVPRFGPGTTNLVEALLLLIALALVLRYLVSWLMGMVFPPSLDAPWDKVGLS